MSLKEISPEGEMRSYLDPRCLKEPAVKEVGRLKDLQHHILMCQVLDSLLAWLNTSLADSRVRLMELEDDLKDGMVLKLILCKLTGQVVPLPVPGRPPGLGRKSHHFLRNWSCPAETLSSRGRDRRPI